MSHSRKVLLGLVLVLGLGGLWTGPAVAAPTFSGGQVIVGEPPTDPSEPSSASGTEFSTYRFEITVTAPQGQTVQEVTLQIDGGGISGYNQFPMAKDTSGFGSDLYIARVSGAQGIGRTALDSRAKGDPKTHIWRVHARTSEAPPNDVGDSAVFSGPTVIGTHIFEHRIKLYPIDKNGNQDAGYADLRKRSGLTVEPTDPLADDAGTGSSTYTFRVMYKQPDGLIPRLFRGEGGVPTMYLGEQDVFRFHNDTYVSGLLFQLDVGDGRVRYHYMTPDTDLGAPANPGPNDFINGVIYKYVVLPTDTSVSWSGSPTASPPFNQRPGRIFDDNFVAFPPGEDTVVFNYLASDDIITTEGGVQPSKPPRHYVTPADAGEPGFLPPFRIPSVNPVLKTDILPGLGLPFGDAPVPASVQLDDGRTGFTPLEVLRGSTGSTFTWRVIYQQSRNQAPLRVRVHIKRLSSATGQPLGEIAGSPFTMVEEDPGDTVYSDGKAYIHQRILTEGSYRFWFDANDGTRSTEWPGIGGDGGSPGTSLERLVKTNWTNGIQVNNKPQLSNASVAPSSGIQETQYTYKVTYKDIDNDAPVSGRLFIDQILTPTKVKRIEGNNVVVFEGVDLGPDKPLLPGLPSVFNPAGDNLVGAQIRFTSGNARDRAYTITANTRNSSGENQVTVSGDLVADGVANNDQLLVPAHRVVNMEKEDPNDSTYNDGVVYKFVTGIDVQPAPGERKYAFAFTDNWFDAQNPFVGETVRLPAGDNNFFAGPLVTFNTRPSLSNGEVTPTTGTPATLFTYNVTYTDADNNPPVSIRVFIDGTPSDMTKANPNDNIYTDGVIYKYQTRLAQGDHRFHFEASDGFTNGDVATVDVPGPTVTANTKPTLVNADTNDNNVAGTVFDSTDPAHTKVTGSSSTIFEWRIKYTDADNNDPQAGSPALMQVVIDGKAFDMTKEDPGDLVFSDGMVYIYKSTLASGTHTYHFEANDGFDAVRFPPSGEITNPKVNDPPTLTNADVQPHSGTGTTSFKYTVTYTDPDNDAPDSGYPKVWIDDATQADANNSHAMSKTDPTDTLYTDGVAYEFTIPNLSAGKHSFHIEAVSSGGGFTQTVKTDEINFPSINNPPTLTLNSVTPADGRVQGSANGETTFVYQVTYTDQDNNPPSSVKIHILQDGAEVTGSPFAMNASDPSDTTYTDGAVYRYETKLATAGAKYEYFFEASDGTDPTRLPADTSTFAGPTVNTAPVLSDGKVDPTKGAPSQAYTYTVTFTDADGDLPASIQVHIIKPDGTTELGAFDMAGVDAQDTNTKDGKAYQFVTSSSTTPPTSPLEFGTYKFYFTAADNRPDTAKETVRLPSGTAALTGPAINTVPTLTLNSVTPADGRVQGSANGETTFVYQVTYTDQDNNPPSSVKIHILQDGAEVTGSPFAMNASDPSDTTYTDGAVYRYETKLATAGAKYEYFFEASDGVDAIRFPSDATKTFAGPTVNTAPVLSNGSVNPTTGGRTGVDSKFTYEVTFTDADGDLPDTMQVHIIKPDNTELGTGFNMVEADPGDTDTRNGKVYRFLTGDTTTPSTYPLDLGTYKFYFTAADNRPDTAKETVRLPSGTATFTGPTIVQRKPTLEDATNRQTQVARSTFTFRVKVTDLDNDPPAAGWPKVQIRNPDGTLIYPAGPQTMTEEDANDTVFSDGKTYKFDQVLNQHGAYSYYFEVSDGSNIIRLPANSPDEFKDKIFVNAPPTFADAKVLPTTGPQNTKFSFEVTYKDADEDAPTSIQVTIIKPDKNTLGSFDMTTSDTTPYSTGRVFKYETTLADGGTYAFHMDATDGYDNGAIRIPQTGDNSGPLVTIGNAPVLSNPSVTPDPAAIYVPGTEFTYSVKYQDADNDPPTVIEVVISGPESHTVPLTTTDTGAYTAGRTYTGKQKLSAPGIYKYHFHTSDGSNGVTLPDTGDSDGPTINTRPALSDQAVAPTKGFTTTDKFTYTVVYKDADGARQTHTVKLFIDGADSGIIPTVTGKPEDGGGATYTFADKTFAAVKDKHIHSFHFEATDGLESVVLYDDPVTKKEFAGPSVNTAPALSDGSVTPTTGDKSVSFVYKVTYTDADNDDPLTAPAYLRVHIKDPAGKEISGSPFAMVEDDAADTDRTDGKVYKYATVPPALDQAGAYRYSFEANDGQDPTTVATTAEAEGPTITVGNAPTLTEGKVTPAADIAGSAFKYSIKYTDKDNEAPTYVKITIRDPNNVVVGTFDMTTTDTTPVTNGRSYEYTTNTLATHGRYTWRAEASDGTNIVGSGELTGPDVNTAPTLTSDSVTPSEGPQNTAFTYQVKYADADKDAPVSIQVKITNPDGSAHGNPIDMTTTDTSDLAAGRVYKAQASDLTVGGIYKYEIVASDGFGNGTVTTGVKTGPTVRIGSAPVLKDNSVVPAGIQLADTEFTYTVNYSDADNDAPKFVRVIITKPNGTAHGTFDMTTSDTTSYITGRNYTYKTKLSDEGTYKYHFETTDGNNAVRFPDTGEFDGPQVNHKPILSDTGIDTLDPDKGLTNETDFTYSVKYTDRDGASQTHVVHVVIDGQVFAMSTADDVTKGATYTYKTRLAAGSHKYHFEATDGLNPVRLPADNTQELTGPFVNTPPTLTGGAVSPTSGNTNTHFIYTVTYTDADGNEPTSIQLFVTKPDGTAFTGSPFNMVAADTNPVTGGRVYKYEMTTGLGIEGTFKFHMEATDGVDPTRAARFPATGEQDGPKVTKKTGNKAPVLSNDSVSPATGITTTQPATEFTYLVTYTDADDDPPASLKLFIVDQQSNTIGHDVLADGAKVDPSDNTYTNGVVYQFKISGLTPGDNSYYWEASDGTDSDRLPDTGSNTGPHVNRKPTLTGTKVTPESGPANSQFVYETTYTDLDNEAPSYVRVFVDGVGFNMTPRDATDTKYDDGAIFEYKTTDLKKGVHKFYVEASDGLEVSRDPATDEIQKPVVDSPPVLSNIKVVSSSGSYDSTDPTKNLGKSTDSYTWSLTWTDADGDGPAAPGYLRVVVDGAPFDMKTTGTPTADQFKSGVTYTYTAASLQPSVLMPDKKHTYHFEASDSELTVRVPASGETDGPNVNAAPALANGKVSPSAGHTLLDFTYSVVYSDADGAAPQFVRVFIDRDAAGVQMAKDPNSNDFVAGVTYSYTTKLAEAPKHTFHFEAFDGLESARFPATGEREGPTVGANVAPVLSNDSVTPNPGKSTDTFTYTVTYSDANGDSPGFVRVVIDGTPNDMTTADANPDYKTGVVFTFQTTLTPSQSVDAKKHTYHFETSDSALDARLPATGEKDGPYVNTPPQLISGAVNPTTGTTATDFKFSVTYKDVDNNDPTQTPGYIRVVIGTETFNLARQDTKPFTEGSVFAYTTKLKAGSGTKFHFEASDGLESVRFPAEGDLSVGLVNTPPTLKNGKVDPASGKLSTEFVYSVEYSDVDGDAAQSVQVFIDGSADANAHTMAKQGDTNVYQFKTKLAAGDHNFFFQATDVKGGTTKTDVQQGPTVNVASLTLDAIAPVDIGTTVTYKGKLTPARAVAIGITVVAPDGTPTASTVTSAADGTFTGTFTPDASGVWKVKAKWSGDANYDAVSAETSVTVNAPSLTLGPGVDMVSLPVIPIDTDPDLILTNAAALDIVRWLPVQAKYSFFNTDNDFPGITAGSGFWVNPAASVKLEPRGKLADQTQAFAIQMFIGWNQFGSVFTAPINWAATRVRYQGQTVPIAQAAANGWIRDYAWGYNKSTRSYFLVHATQQGATRQIVPWRGYWIRALVDCELILVPAGAQAAAVGPVRSEAGATAPEWMQQIVASAAGASDTSNYIGVSNSTQGMAIEKPAYWKGYVDLHFTGSGRAEGGAYAVDIKPKSAGRMVWNFEVRTDQPNTDITITWPKVVSVPKDVDLTLVDVDGGKSRFLRTTSAYTFNSGKADGVRRFQIVAEPRGAGTLMITSITDSGSRGVSRTISYTLTAEAEVSAQILSLTGKPVRMLAARQAATRGTNQIVWDGRDGQGRVVPAGVYLVQITATAQDGNTVKAAYQLNMNR